MADVVALVKAGVIIGFGGEDLKNFVKEQQEFARQQRALEREKLKDSETLKGIEMEKLTLEM